jgi:hypothetical protein
MIEAWGLWVRPISPAADFISQWIDRAKLAIKERKSYEGEYLAYLALMCDYTTAHAQDLQEAVEDVESLQTAAAWEMEDLETIGDWERRASRAKRPGEGPTLLRPLGETHDIHSDAGNGSSFGRTYKIATVRDAMLGGMSDDTLRKYAAQANVPLAGIGKKSHRWNHHQTIAILKVIESEEMKKHRAKATAAIAALLENPE